MRMAETFTFRKSGTTTLIPVPREHTLKAQAVAGAPTGTVGTALSALVGSAGPGRKTLAKAKVDLARELMLVGGGADAGGAGSLTTPPQRVEREAVFRLPLAAASGQAGNNNAGALTLRVRLLAELTHVKGGGLAVVTPPSAAVLPPTASGPSFSSSFGGGSGSGGFSPSAPSSPSFAQQRRQRRPSGVSEDNNPTPISSGDWDDGGGGSGDVAEWRPAAAQQQQQHHHARRRPLSCPSGEAAEELCAAAAKAAREEQEEEEARRQQQRNLASWARPSPSATGLATTSAPLRVWPFGSSNRSSTPTDALLRQLLRLAEQEPSNEEPSHHRQLLLDLSSALAAERASWARHAEDSERRAKAALASKRLITERLTQVEGQVALLDEGHLVDALVEAKTAHAQAGLEAEALRGELRGERRRAAHLEAALALAKAEIVALREAAAVAAGAAVVAPAFVG
jgi:hypothetical protein